MRTPSARTPSLRSAVERFEQAPPPAVDADVARQIEELRGEVQLLSEELDKKEQVLHEVQQSRIAAADAGDMPSWRRKTNGCRNSSAENERVIAELRAKGPVPAAKNSNDLERYEAELNEFRRQLETDRNKLNRECEMLRERNKELDEAIREMEMEMSKEC